MARFVTCYQCLLAFALCIVFLSAPTFASSRADIAAICDEAAGIVSAESGVPLDVLRAISLTETGRKKGGRFQPWPWTVNMEGVGKWFDDYASAQSYVDRHFDRGARSFDVGCFQINYRWHGHAFASVEEMFDPLANARYAARFLGELHDEFGDWSRAAGAYHSRTPTLARKYAARFNRIRARLPAPPQTPAPEAPILLAAAPADVPTFEPRLNRYPLLVRGHSSSGLGSLVPSAKTEGRFLNLEAARPLDPAS